MTSNLETKWPITLYKQKINLMRRYWAAYRNLRSRKISFLDNNSTQEGAEDTAISARTSYTWQCLHQLIWSKSHQETRMLENFDTFISRCTVLKVPYASIWLTESWSCAHGQLPRGQGKVEYTFGPLGSQQKASSVIH